jgi:hypothetical protein
MPAPFTIEKFWARVEKTDTCWIWRGPTNVHGYGRVGIHLRKQYAHRVAWTLTNGEVPAGLCLLHRCDNPPCVNPAHLFLGTRSDNAKDKVSKGRQSKGDSRPNAKLSMDKAEAIRREHAQGAVSACALARRYGVRPSQITRVLRGVGWVPRQAT